jgi:tetratricopeptide (TPR) repeat protein
MSARPRTSGCGNRPDPVSCAALGAWSSPHRGFAGRWPERPLHVSEATIHNLENVTAAYRRMYHTVAAHDLIDDVAQHAQTTAGFWRRAADPELRRSLAAATSEITMLAGRMSFFDLGRPSQAEPYYRDALEAAEEAQDRPLQAVVLGNKSFLPRSRGDFATALQLLDQAKRLVPDDPTVRSWAMALEAMTKAWAQEPPRAWPPWRPRRASSITPCRMRHPHGSTTTIAHGWPASKARSTSA